MAALLHDHPRSAHHHATLADPVARFFALEPAVDEPEERPALRVIPGGREAVLRRRLPDHVYRARRRLVALVAGVVLLTAVALVSILTVPGGASAPADAVSSPAPAPVVAPPALEVADDGTYLVQPGDTLWSIAESLRPSGDVRPLVDELAERVGSGSLQAGARIDLSDLAG
jgi:hypothetical protein